MRKKLNCVLLIDDDEPTNYLNEMVINQSDCTEKIVAVQSGQAALDYLTTKDKGVYTQPDIIFLDINMPKMNGWEFLEHYKKLDKEQQGGVVVVMLTTSLNPDDRLKAGNIGDINDFMSKPLTIEMVNKVLDKYFVD